MKDARGHGSDARGGGNSDVQDAATRRGMALHEMTLRDIGRVGQLKWALQDRVNAFMRSQSGAGPQGTPLSATLTEFLRAPATGLEHLADFGSHLRDTAE